MSLRAAFALAAFHCLALAPIQAEDWPRWRGAAGVGLSGEERLPTRWGPGENVLWRFDDPGLGHSSPIVWGDALFFTTAADESRLLLRLDAASGKERWRREVVRSALEAKHERNSHASSTPATDGERVYIAFLEAPKIAAAAYDFAGKLAWRASPGEFHSRHGYCSSPLLFEDLVILNCDQDDPGACLVALDRRDGAVRWRTPREGAVRSYTPPTLFTIDGRPQVILSGSKMVCAYDPRSGRRLWKCDGPTEQCVASVVLGDGLVFVTGGYPDREFLAIDPRGTGDVTATHVRWRARRGVSYVPSPVYREGHFYVVSDSGVLSVLGALDGEYKNQKRLDGDFSASLLYGAGHLYCASEDGKVHVLRAAPSLETVAVIDMREPIYASPIAAGGRLYLRTWKRLYAIDDQSLHPAQPGHPSNPAGNRRSP